MKNLNSNLQLASMAAATLLCAVAASAQPVPPRSPAQIVQQAYQKQLTAPFRGSNLQFLCAKSKPDEFRGFSSISGTLASDSVITITGSCFGSQKSVFIVANSASSQPVQIIYDSFAGVLPEIVATPRQLQLQIPTYTTQRPPLTPPKVLVLQRIGENGINFRAVLTQQDVDTLRAGGTLTNPPVSR
jgi:hypothetical protein